MKHKHKRMIINLAIASIAVVMAAVVFSITAYGGEEENEKEKVNYAKAVSCSQSADRRDEDAEEKRLIVTAAKAADKKAQAAGQTVEIVIDTSHIEEFIRPDLIPYITEKAAEYGIKAELIEAVIETESGGQQYARCGDCKGLMQVSQKYNSDRMKELGVTDLYDEKGNIAVGIDNLWAWHEMYGDDLYLVLGKYNGQSDCAEGVPNEYAQKILDRTVELEKLHDYGGKKISVEERKL